MKKKKEDDEELKEKNEELDKEEIEEELEDEDSQIDEDEEEMFQRQSNFRPRFRRTNIETLKFQPEETNIPLETLIRNIPIENQTTINNETNNPYANSNANNYTSSSTYEGKKADYTLAENKQNQNPASTVFQSNPFQTNQFQERQNFQQNTAQERNYTPEKKKKVI